MNTKLNFLMVLALLVILVGASASTAQAQEVITISPDTLPNGAYATPYNQQLSTDGGTAPYTFSVTPGSALPSGLILGSDGLLSGFPYVTPASYPLSIMVRDGAGATATREYTLVIAKGTPNVYDLYASPATWGHPFGAHVEVETPDGLLATDGTVEFSVDGTVVPGCDAVVFDSSQGAWLCHTMPSDLSVGSHTVKAAFTPGLDSADLLNSAEAELTITVIAGSYSLNGFIFEDANKNGVYDDIAGLAGWTVNLDEGCDATIDLTATTASNGWFSFDSIPGAQCIRITEVLQPGWQQTSQALPDFMLSQDRYDLQIGGWYPTIRLSPSSLPTGTVGVDYSQQMSADGGTTPYTFTWSAEAGSVLPPGLTLSEAGLISGTPTQAGSYGGISIRAEDADGAVGTRYNYTIDIPSPLTEGTFNLTSSLNPSPLGAAVTFTLTGTGDAVFPGYGTVPPIGYVTFTDNGTPIADCPQQILNVDPVTEAFGNYPATCTTSALAAGPHTIQAVYTDETDLYKDATLTLTQQVGQPSSYTISGSIFLDKNRDGGKDEGESTLYSSGPVYLNQGCDDTVDDYTTWLADGGYAFSGLPGGECYRITVEIEESGLKQYTELADFTLNGDVPIDIGFNYPPITITPPPGTEAIPAELPSGNVGVAYYQEFAASGGAEPYEYQIVKSYLPDGLTLTLSEDGGVLVLSGTPTVGGLYGFEVGVWDANGAPLLDAYGYPASAYYGLVIKTDAGFTFTSSANPSAAGEAVTFTVSATGNAVLLSNGPIPPIGWVTLSADGIPIEGCTDLNLNIGDSGIGDYPAICTTAALEAGSHQITAAYTDYLEVEMGFGLYNTPTLALTQVVGESTNTAPAANPGGPYLAAVNTTLSFDGSLSTDPDGDPLTYAWDFGDGATGTDAQPSHSYSAAGIYNVCLMVNDGTGDSAPACTLAVAYDPSAGFVTGGGWIDSPAGAYVEDPTLTAQATFGFVSKYKKGATVPEGTTEFLFQAGSFSFTSIAYEWLVVNRTGNTAQFKGSGLVNGVADPNGNTYKFQVWAGDGSPDTFRIKIWWEADGVENVVYDNGFNQAIGGGNLIVHVSK